LPPTKLQFYSELADRQARQVTGSREDWTGFLETAGRLYKYPFDEQLMIYAQRPDATACAPLEMWNKPMNRSVRRGSKGIALIDHSSDKPQLRYVFDYADTIDGRYNPRRPFIWEMKPEHEQPVMEALDSSYGIRDHIINSTYAGQEDTKLDVGDYIFGLAHELAARYYDGNARDIGYAAEGSYLEDYDDFNLSVAFKDAMTVSAAYSIMTRCGIDPDSYFEHEDFLPVFDFNTPDAVYTLGKAVSEVTEEVLREIEVTIKKFKRLKTAERSETHERTDIQPDRGLSDTRHSDTGEPSAGQIRDDAEELPERQSPGIVQPALAFGEAVPPLSGDRGHGEREAGNDDEAVAGEGPAAEQSGRPDGLDGVHEQPESPSGGNNLRRTDLQLEQESNETPEEAPSDMGGVSSSKAEITDNDITDYLKKGSVTQDGKYRIYSFFLHDHDTKEKADFLKNEYGYGGGTYYFADGERGHDESTPSKGISITRGGYLEPVATVSLTWVNAANRIDRLIADGEYMSQAEIDRLPSYERQILGAEIIRFYSDIPDDIAHPTFVGGMFGDFWGSARKLGDMLDNPNTLSELFESMRYIMANTPEGDRYHETREKALDDLTVYADGKFTLFPNMPETQLRLNPLPVFPTEQEQIAAIRETELTQIPPAPVVISQDDIDSALRDWNGDHGSLRRLYDYMSEHGRSREAAAFLQNEYGKPDFVVTKDGAEPVTLPWVKVQRRIAQLISENDFISVEPETTAEPEPEAVMSADALPEPEPERTAPPPVFLPDKNAVYSFDLSLYNDRDTLGYDQNGVEYSVMRMGGNDFINTTTRITPMGDILGVNNIPPEILRQIRLANGHEAPEPPTAEQSEYILHYSYVNDRLIVFNHFNFDPDEFSPIVARVEPDGNIVIVDENLPEALWLEIRRVADTELDRYKAESEARLKQMLDAAAIANEQFDRQEPEKPIDPQMSLFDISYNAADIEPDSEADSGITEQVREELLSRGFVVSDELIADGLSDYGSHGGRGNIQDIADFIEDEYLTEEAAWDYEQVADDTASLSPYTVGDTVYLENDRAFIIEVITAAPFNEVKLLDTTTIIPITRVMKIGDFEREYGRNPKNSAVPEAAEPPISEPLQEAEPPKPVQSPVNFRITDDNLGVGGAKTKYGFNIAAIKTLQSVEAENRGATPEEQEILSLYVGWGGLPQAFDSDNQGWAKEYAELKSLLSHEEYDSARASTLNAHYTSPVVIKAMYETLERLGFREGNLLEPAMGAGNFFGLLPGSMKNVKLYGVELDSITGRIAKQLYQDADIKVTGFEKTGMPDAFFDVAIGNVPFGSYKLTDKRYDKHNFLIHDYFFAKALDQVRPGGIVAFITSKGTLDKANPEARKYIAQRAELLGAVRLPNNAFKANAGTEVTSDIIFLQKRDRLIDIQPDWVHLGQTDDGVPVNRYFADNPHMILGKMTRDDMLYGNISETTCNPIEGADLAEQLKEAFSYIQGEITEIELDDIEGIQDISIPADPSVRNFSYTLIDGAVYYRENSRMNPVDMPATTLERVKGMVGLRDCVRELIDYQLHDYPESDIRDKQNELNSLYDSFTRKFGLISDNANNKAFSADSAYYLLCSLEIIDENGELERKSDMFTKRTIKQKTDITSVDTSAEALAVSIAKKAKVDMDYMMGLTGFTAEKIMGDLQGVVFCDIGNPNRSIPEFNPETMKLYEKFPLVTADEYLSGNVREKLHRARRFNELAGDEFHGISTAVNVKALEQAQPKDLEASEIAVRLGSTWVDKFYIRQFMFELLQPSRYLRDVINVNYAERTGEWNIEGKTRTGYNDVLATVTYGTARANAYKIIEETLNLKDMRIYDTVIDNDGKEKRVLNKKETTLAVQKQDAIKQAFKDWIFRDPERRRILVQQYNERFNSIRNREYDGSHIEFVGASPEISLKPHQRDAIARILYGGNTLLAHEVGAGKTFEMVGAAMEMKRLGLCQKSLMAVPNHLTEQMASEFLRLYPSANILVSTKKDFETRNRKKFCAKIATGDYDAVIIGHTQLERIPLSKERQERLLNEQINEIAEGIAELKENYGERFTIKQMEKTKKSLEARLDKLTDDSRKDDVVTFEQLGVDRLFVDESHNFKNLFLYTKMRNVAGLSTSEAQKSSDMFMKCRYMDEITGGKGVIFATGTPVTNSIAELYTVQRYLQYNTLVKNGLLHFDAWASTFGETQTSIELSPEGSGYRARTRFAKFTNLPELMGMFKEVADIKTADTLDLPRPKANFHTVVADPSEIQRDMVKELSERAKDVHDRKVDPTQDNMLKITSDGRKIGLDQRLMNPLLPDDETSKVNACMNNIYRIWDETSAERLTQLVFCDFSTPNKDGRFNVYDDIKEKLIAKGIPEHEIAFIHDANTELQKKELFAKVRSGNVRIMFGSTFKMGAGTNVQDRLIAMHDLDCPWRPADLQQRAGRIVRQGNRNEEVDIYRYCTQATFDSYLFQTVEKKQEFISQIMTSKSPVRSCDDVDEDALSYAEIKALCAGNPHIKEKMQLDVEVAKLKLLKSDHQSQQYRLQDDLLTNFPKRITESKGFIEAFKSDLERLETHKHSSEEGISPMTIGNKIYTDRGEAGAALMESFKGITSTTSTKIGSYRGFDMLLSFDTVNRQFNLAVKGAMTHTVNLGDDAFGNITRINNAFDRIPQRLQSVEAQLQTLYDQTENAKAELEKPFAFEAEFAEKTARLAELDAMLNMDEAPEPMLIGDEVDEVAKAAPSNVSAKEKPSILEALKSGAEKSKTLYGAKQEPEKKPEIFI